MFKVQGSKCKEMPVSKLKIMLSATEVSGDIHASNLVRAIKRIHPSTDFIGVGGERMQEAGVDLKAFTVHMGTIGLLEGVRYYPFFLRIKSMLEKILREEPPDLVVLIDSRDFNLRLIHLANKFEIPTVYYVAPPVWAWPDWQAKNIARRVTRIIAIFPFEVGIYEKLGANVTFVGHPLVDVVRPRISKEEAYRRFDLDPHKPIIGLLPGSREHEINKLLPVMLSSAYRLRENLKEVQFLLPVAASIFRDKIAKMVEKSAVPVKITDNGVYELMNISDLLITASGTATLEAACLNTPMIILYKTSISTYLLGKILLKLPYVGLPNILANKRIVPELLQFRATKDHIADLSSKLLTDSGKLEQMKTDLRKVAEKLGKPGAIDRAARAILETATSKKDKKDRR